MSLGEEEFGALALETAEEEVGAELQEVAGLVLEDFAVEGADFVRVVAWESHDRPVWSGCSVSLVMLVVVLLL
jgi:hypothetical protein